MLEDNFITATQHYFYFIYPYLQVYGLKSSKVEKKVWARIKAFVSKPKYDYKKPALRSEDKEVEESESVDNMELESIEDQSDVTTFTFDLYGFMKTELLLMNGWYQLKSLTFISARTNVPERSFYPTL